MKTINEWASFGGRMSVHTHDSKATGTEMTFGVYTPSQAADGPVPVITYLSGLTCNWSNVMEKGGVQRIASELGVMVVAPDTSPRGDGVADDDAYDLGQGAGFYLTATEAPWGKHYRMDEYLTEDLQGIIAANFPANISRQAITGHSMGGHGALTLHLKHPELYQACSAFAPIVSPCRVPWGQKALEAYLGPQSVAWEAYDAVELVKERQTRAHILIDQGEADQFLETELRPELFRDACKAHGQTLTLRRQPGYDHSYYFIASFMDDHLRHLAAAI